MKLGNKKSKNIQDRIRQKYITRYLVTLAFILIPLLLWYIIFYQPSTADISNYSSRVAEWKQKIRMASVSKDAISKLEQNVDTLTVQIAEIEKRIYHLDDMQRIADELLKYSRNHRLRVQTMIPNYDVLFPVDQEIGSPLVKVPLELKMTGRYYSLGRFLSDVNRLPFIFSPDELFLEADAKIYPQLRITVIGYLFLSTEERTQSGSEQDMKKIKQVG